MAVVRCPRGHYYDDSRFSFCPYCGISPEMTSRLGKADEDKEPVTSGKERKKGVFSLFDFDHDKTVAVKSGDETASGLSSEDRKTSKSIFGFRNKPAFSSESETVALNSDNTDGSVTVAMEAKKGGTSDDDIRTVGLFSGARGNDYVTGWLVCIKGPEKGRDYRLHHGQNKMGRGFSMDVMISDDDTISADRHFTIVYDDKSLRFFVVPGSGTLTYLNDELLSQSMALSDGDELKAGNSSFIFIPFCREGRTWEEEK